jgi:hypothetical protein
VLNDNGIFIIRVLNREDKRMNCFMVDSHILTKNYITNQPVLAEFVQNSFC